MNPILIFGAIAAIIAFAKKAAPVVAQKASQSLGLAANPSTSSSTPVPTPSNNTPSGTPPFFQQSNSATPSEPITKLSFDPLDLSGAPVSGSQDRKGVIAAPVKTRTVSNINVLDNTWNEKLQNFQTRPVHQFIADTELSSVSEEQSYAYDTANGTPDNPQVNNSLAFVSAKLNNAGGSNGTYPATPHAGILQYAHRLAPTPSRNTSIEKTVPQIANKIVKSSFKPEGKVTHPSTFTFKPLTRVYEA